MLIQTLITDYFHVCMDNKMKQIIKKKQIQTFVSDYYCIKKRKFSHYIDFCKINYFDEINDNNNNKNKVCGYNPESDSWHCLECGVNMGPQNPRQLCGKYYCHYGKY